MLKFDTQLQDNLPSSVVEKLPVAERTEKITDVPDAVTLAEIAAEKQHVLLVRETRKAMEKEQIQAIKVQLRGGQLGVTERLQRLSDDRGEEAFHLEKEKAGFVGKIFNYGILQEIYKKISSNRERARILGDEGLLFGNGLNKADVVKEKQALFEQACRENQSLDAMEVKPGEKQRRFGDRPEEKAVKNGIKNLITDYVGGVYHLYEKLFEEKKKTLLAEMAALAPEVRDEGVMYMDNIKAMAEQVRVAAETAGGLQNLDIDLELVVGQAKMGANTERQRGIVDRVLEKLNERTRGVAGVVYDLAVPSIALAVAAGGLHYVGIDVGQGGSYLAPALGALISGSFAAQSVKNGLRDQWAAHQRSIAEHNAPASSPKEIEKMTIRGIPATELTENLITTTEKLTPGVSILHGVRVLAEIESRLELGKAEKRDYISFSSGKNQQEGLDLYKARFALKAKLREMYSDDVTIDKTQWSHFDEYYASVTHIFTPDQEKTVVGQEQKKRHEAEVAMGAWARRRGFVHGAIMGAFTFIVGVGIDAGKEYIVHTVAQATAERAGSIAENVAEPLADVAAKRTKSIAELLLKRAANKIAAIRGKVG